MRIVRADSGAVSLQIAVRQFQPADRRGPSIWLVGASHVGESNYYAALQKHLDRQGLVLFEGVGAKSRRPQFDPEEETSLQHTMAGALGVVFQLQAVRYDREHFRNSDLTIAQLQQLLQGRTRGAEAEAGGSGAGADQEFDQLLQMMDGRSTLGFLLHIGLKLIGSSAKLQAMTKLVLIEALGGVQGDMAQMKGLPPSIQRLMVVIIQERNKVVLADLASVLKARPRPVSIGVFYGAGHMADLEKRLRANLNYRPRSEVWLTALSVDLQAAGLSSTEVDAMRQLVRWQLDALQPAGDKTPAAKEKR